jgi:hypothetical protein
VRLILRSHDLVDSVLPSGFPSHEPPTTPLVRYPSPTISVASLVFQLLSFAACICPDSVIPYSSLLSTCSISADPPLLLPPCLSYACLFLDAYLPLPAFVCTYNPLSSPHLFFLPTLSSLPLFPLPFSFSASSPPSYFAQRLKHPLVSPIPLSTISYLCFGFCMGRKCI